MRNIFSPLYHWQRREKFVVVIVLFPFIHYSGAGQGWCSRKEKSGSNSSVSEAPEVSSLPQVNATEDALSQGTSSSLLLRVETTTLSYGEDVRATASFYDAAANGSTRGDILDTGATSLSNVSSGTTGTVSVSSSYVIDMDVATLSTTDAASFSTSGVTTVSSKDVPTIADTDVPSVTDTDVPSVTDTDVPSVTDTDAPSVTDTDIPSVTDTDVPSVTDTDVPSVTDTDVPSVTDTDAPSVTDTDAPSVTVPYRDYRDSKAGAVWDASAVSAEDYVHSYCPRRCRDGEVVFINDAERKCPDYLCFPCDCERPRCELYGVCCPDITEPYHPLPGLPSNYTAFFSSPAPLAEQMTFEETNVTSPVLFCDDVSSDEGNFLVISSCQPGFHDERETATLCEAESGETDFSPRAFTRVADVVNNVVYRNVYCAICNGVDEPVPFVISIECLDYMYVYTANSPGEIIQLASDPQSRCRVEQLVPTGVSTVRCHPAFFSRDAIDTCDTTNATSWTDEQNVSRACAEVNGSIYSVVSPYTGNLYKNLFCGICHMESYPSFGLDCECNEGVIVGKVRDPLPLTLLLRFVDDDGTHSGGTTLPTCQTQEWLTPDGRCLPVNCDPGKIPRNESCSSVFTGISGLQYRIHLWLLPRADNSTRADNNETAQILRALDMKIDNFSRRFCSNSSFYIGVARYPSISRPNITEMKQLYWIELNLTGKSYIPRDKLEEKIVNEFILNDIDIVSEEKTATLQPLVMAPAFTNEVVCSDQPNGDVCERLVAEFGQPRYRSGGSAVEVSPLLTCAFVTFGKQEYSLEVNPLPPMVTINLDLHAVKINFSTVSEINMLEIAWDGGLKVCVDLLNTKLRGFIRKDKEPMNGFLELVTWLSMGVSMFCLLITFLTYTFLAALRNVAGVHNMFLSGSLLCAQALILISSKLEQPSTECTVIGVVTHYFWLFKFSSTLVCCLHMYHVFNAEVPVSCHAARRRRRSLVLRCAVFTLSVPTLVVLGVILFHLFTTQMQSVGYGGSRCYLDSPTVVGVTLAGPALLISSCNILLFALTVRAIGKVSSLADAAQVHRDHRTNLYVYAKLSTMTGVFWTLSILAENLNVDILRFIAITVNGLQGVFIIFSYTFNKRVLRMCLPRLSRGSDVTVKSQSPLTTTNTAD